MEMLEVMIQREKYYRIFSQYEGKVKVFFNHVYNHQGCRIPV